MADMEVSGEEVGAPQQHAAVEESLDGEKTTSLIINTAIQTDERMPAELVNWILGMPMDKPDDIVKPSCLQGEKNMAEILGVTEEWLENMRQTYKDVALRTQRIHDDFVKYQAQIRDELFEKDYVEVDEDYFTDHAEFGEEMRAMCGELEKKRDPTLTFADYSDYNLPYDYEGRPGAWLICEGNCVQTEIRSLFLS